MIVAGTNPPITIDLGSNELGMTLQHRYYEHGYLAWRDYLVDGKWVTAPIDLESLPSSVYRLLDWLSIDFKGIILMENQRTPEQAIELIEYLVSEGKRPKSFESVFPRIHHLKGGTMQAHLNYIKGPDAVKAYTSQTNQNVVKRMELIKSLVDEFLLANPNSDGINEFKYQKFAAQAVEQVPFK